MNDREKIFADFLTANNKTYISQPPKFKLKKTTYRTDFYCPENDTYYEVVGSRQAFHSLKPKLIEFVKTNPEINFKIVKPNGQEFINKEKLLYSETIRRYERLNSELYPEYFPFVMTAKMKTDLIKLARKKSVSIAEVIRTAIREFMETENQ